MLKSPSHITVGVSNIERTSRFLQAFGFVRESDSLIGAFAARELYGLRHATSEARLTMPGAAGGSVRLIATGQDAVEGGPFDCGAHAVDLYVRNMEEALEIVKNTHASIGPVAAYPVGPMTVRECQCDGPDGLALVLIEVDRRRPSVLDSNPACLFSEVHAGVWVVDSLDVAGPFWKAAGLNSLLDATFAEPSVAQFMHLPRPDTRLRLAVLADEAARPARLELIEFPDSEARKAPVIPALPLRPGRFLFGFEVDDVPAACLRLTGAEFSKLARIGADRIVTGTAPGGVGFELRTGRI